MTESDKELTFTQHLEELRGRLGVILVSVFIFFVLSYHWTPAIIHWATRGVGPLVFIAPAEAFLARLKVAFYAGLFLSLPVILFEIWRFVALGLSEKERRGLKWAVPSSYLLFVAGVGLALFVVGPKAIKFLMAFGSDQIVPMITVSSYIRFIFFLALAFGLLFQLPLVVLFLGKLGLVSCQQLRAYRKIVYLGIFVAAALLTPGPDIFSQLILALPTILLYEISIWLVPKEASHG